MRPYLSILKDSFREALVSRLLWVLLILATVFLLAVAPVRMTERSRSQIYSQDFTDVIGFARKLIKQGRLDEPSPAKQVWDRLDENTQQMLIATKTEDANQIAQDLHLRELLETGLNDLLRDQELYSKQAWSDFELDDEALALVAQNVDDLAEPDVARLNRLLLEAAFPEHLRSSFNKQLFMGWLFWEQDNAMVFNKAMAIEVSLTLFVDYFLGVVGVMLAIIVTASIVPNTFEAGAIDLLLSKPILRSLLFLTKVIGGCAFILLAVSYVIAGLWLILGLRFDYWNHRLLLCIPLMMFLFAIYYSVSAFVGVIWKNAIISVVMTIVFWAACWVVWLGKTTVFENVILGERQIIELTSIDDELICIQKEYGLFRWTNKTDQWEEIFQEDHYAGWTQPVERPVYDTKNKRLMALGRVFEFGMGIRSEAASLFFAEQDEQWTRHTGPPPPAGSKRMFVRHDGEMIIVGTNQVYRIDGTLDHTALNDTTIDTPMDDAQNETKGESKAEEATDVDEVVYTPIGPDDWSAWSSVAMDRKSGKLAVYTRSQLRILKTNATGDYTSAISRDVHFKSDGMLALDGNTLVLSLSDGRVKVFDAETLEERQEFQPQTNVATTQLVVSRDGRWFAALFGNRRLWVYDNQLRQTAAANIDRQGDITAIAFTGEGELNYAHSFNYVTRLDLASDNVTEQIGPATDTPAWIYWYLIKPAYTVFPKPGELGEMVSFLVTSKTTETQFDGTTRKMNIWQPFWSNVAFMSVMLTVGSIYVRRKDF